MNLEEKLQSWTKRSSDSEVEKQERAERMVRQAIANHPAFGEVGLEVFTKGSYANNTNVKSDSDVDVAVKCTEACYWDEYEPGSRQFNGSAYQGIWTPARLRQEVVSALRAKFSDEVDTSGSTAIHVAANSARVDIDVVPCFSYKYYLNYGVREGSKVFKKDGSSLINYSSQQLENGRSKNNSTARSFKRAVRIMKRIENALVEEGSHDALPSYFIECLVYNVPNEILNRRTWVDTIEGVIVYIYRAMEGAEPSERSKRWLEVNECKYLFHDEQPWTRQQARSFAVASWGYLGLGS